MIVGIHDVIGRDVKADSPNVKEPSAAFLAWNDIVILRKRELEVALGKLGLLKHLGAEICMGGGLRRGPARGSRGLIGAGLDSVDMPRGVVRPVRAPTSIL